MEGDDHLHRALDGLNLFWASGEARFPDRLHDGGFSESGSLELAAAHTIAIVGIPSGHALT